MLQYRALGGLGVVDGDARGELNLGGSRQRRLAAALLIDRNRVVSVDRLGEVVFAGEPTARAATTLRSYVARLRRVVENGASGTQVVTRAPGYMLVVDDQAFDVARFESAVVTGRAGLAQGDVDGASRALRAGLALWRGAAYAEFADEEWARPEAQRLDELRLVAYDLLADAELARGRSAEVAVELEARVAEHPLRDSFQAKLILALYRSGRQVDALRAYQAHRRYLMDEMGLDPPPELAELEARILAHDESLLDLDPGELRLRGYRLGERLGTGRDGTVYAARLPGVERDIAIRAVPEAVANDPDFVRSFDADARRLGAVRHPAVLPLYDWWREPGAAYVVMRRLRGGTLRDRLQRGPLSDSEATDLVERVGGALAAASAAGVTHGRVTAESILFDDAGRAYLADFPLGGRVAATPDDDARDLAELVGEAVGGPQAAPRPNPYKGLRAFDEPDAADFFGRDALVEALLARLAAGGRFMLVVGGSGSGKSSVVRAGLLSRVRAGAVPGSETWFVATMVPGPAPFEELAESLRRVAVSGSDSLAAELAAGEQGIDAVLRRVVPAGGELLLVVDQLEELFTLAGESDQRSFLDALAHALSVDGSRLRVVATLRADFYDRPLRFERFGAVLGDATVPVAAMSAAELDAAIVGPAERVGGRVEPALVAELVGAVLHEPAALPSLQFTLYELAERADGQLTLDSYRDLGGVEAAIAARAEALYRGLDDPVRAGMRGLFARLVVVGPEGEPTRRRALRSELAASDDVVEAWAQARLLSLDRHPESREPTVEVAHEALLREWPRLRTWLEEDRDQIVARGQLREAAGGWAALDRDPGALYRGARLEVALTHLDGRDQAVPALEREFLAASRAERDRELQEQADRLRQAARSNRRLRLQLAVVGVALVMALVAGVVAVGQRNRATQDSRELALQALIAEVGVANESKRDLAALLALAAYDIAPDVDTYGALLGTFTSSPAARRTVHLDAAPVLAGVPLPNNRTVAVVGTDLGVTLVDLATGQSEPAVAPDPDRELVDAMADASADGRLLAVMGAVQPRAGGDSRVRLIVYDLATGARRLDLEPANGPGSVVVSPDGQLLAVGGGEQASVEILATADGQVVRTVPAEPRPPDASNHFNTVGLSFLPDGSLAVGSEQGALRIVDPRTGTELRRLDGPQEVASAFLFRSADGRVLVGVGPRGLSAWDVDTGLLWTDPDQRFCNAAVVDEQAGRVLCGVDDGEVVAYDVEHGRSREADLGFQHGELNVLAITPDGSTLVEAGEQTVAAWSLDGGGAISRPMAVDSTKRPSEFVGSARLLVGRNGEDADLVDIDEARVVDPLDGILMAGPTSDPDQLAVLYADGSGGLYPLDGGGDVRGERVSLSFAPDNGMLAGDLLVVYDATHIQSFTLDGPAEPAATDEDGAIEWLTLSPDATRLFTLEGGDLVARGPDGERSGPRRSGIEAVDTVDDVTVVATADGRIEVIDPETLEGVGAPLVGIDSPPLALELDAGGRRLAILSLDRTVQLADVTSRQLLGGAISLGDGGTPDDDRNGSSSLNEDGDRLAVYTSYGTVVWDLRPDRMVEAACAVAGRNLTQAEWDQYVGSLGPYRRLCPDAP